MISKEVREELISAYEDLDEYEPEMERLVIQTGYSPGQALLICTSNDPFDDELVQFTMDLFNKVDYEVLMKREYFVRL